MLPRAFFPITTIIAPPSLEPIVIRPHNLLFLLWHLMITPALFNNPLAWVPLRFWIEWVSVRKYSLHRCDVREAFSFRIILQRTFLLEIPLFSKNLQIYWHYFIIHIVKITDWQSQHPHIPFLFYSNSDSIWKKKKKLMPNLWIVDYIRHN